MHTERSLDQGDHRRTTSVAGIQATHCTHELRGTGAVRSDERVGRRPAGCLEIVNVAERKLGHLHSFTQHDTAVEFGVCRDGLDHGIGLCLKLGFSTGYQQRSTREQVTLRSRASCSQADNQRQIDRVLRQPTGNNRERPYQVVSDHAGGGYLLRTPPDLVGHGPGERPELIIATYHGADTQVLPHVR